MKAPTPKHPRSLTLHQLVPPSPKLRAHLVKYATNKAGGQFWSWWLTNGNGSMLCHGPLGFRSSGEARSDAKRTVATIATGRLVRQALLVDA